MTNTQNKANDAKDNRYNGWTNYETWAVSLWIDNDEGSQAYWRQEAQRQVEASADCETVQDGVWTSEQAARFNLAEQLKSETTDNAPDVPASVYSDLMQAALDNVNWREIAENIIAELGE